MIRSEEIFREVRLHDERKGAARSPDVQPRRDRHAARLILISEAKERCLKVMTAEQCVRRESVNRCGGRWDDTADGHA